MRRRDCRARGGAPPAIDDEHVEHDDEERDHRKLRLGEEKGRPGEDRKRPKAANPLAIQHE